MAMRIMARGALSQTCAAAESAKAAAHAHGLVNTRMGKEKKWRNPKNQKVLAWSLMVKRMGTFHVFYRFKMSSVPKVRARRAVRPMTRVVLVAVVLCSIYPPARAALQPLLRLRGGEQGLGEFPKVSAGFWHAVANLRWQPQWVLPAGFGMLSQTFAGYPNGHCLESVCEYAVDMRASRSFLSM
jgi:hypothetical protein